jgi:pseudouridine-5'-phosphate glycosidase
MESPPGNSTKNAVLLAHGVTTTQTTVAVAMVAVAAVVVPAVVVGGGGGGIVHAGTSTESPFASSLTRLGPFGVATVQCPAKHGADEQLYRDMETGGAARARAAAACDAAATAAALPPQ